MMRSATKKKAVKEREKGRATALASSDAMLSHMESVFEQEFTKLQDVKQSFDHAYECAVANLRYEYRCLREELNSGDAPAPATPNKQQKRKSTTFKDVFSLSRRSDKSAPPSPHSAGSNLETRPSQVEFSVPSSSSQCRTRTYIEFLSQREEALVHTLCQREKELVSVMTDREKLLIDALSKMGHRHKHRSKGKRRKHKRHRSHKRHQKKKRGKEPKREAKSEPNLLEGKHAIENVFEKTPASPVSAPDNSDASTSARNAGLGVGFDKDSTSNPSSANASAAPSSSAASSSSPRSAASSPRSAANATYSNNDHKSTAANATNGANSSASSSSPNGSPTSLNNSGSPKGPPKPPPRKLNPAMNGKAQPEGFKSPRGSLKFWERLSDSVNNPTSMLPVPAIKVKEKNNWLCCLQYDSIRQRIVGGSLNSRTIHVWEANGDRLNPLEGHDGIVYCIQIRGNTLVSGSGDGTYKVWDLTTNECVKTVQAHTPKGIVCLQFDDEIVVTGCTLFSIKVWDFQSGEYIRTLRGHLQAVWCLQFDKNRIVSGSEDKMIKVWDRKTGECPMTLKGHQAPVRCLRFDDDIVVSGSEDKTIRIWSLKSGECTNILNGHDATVICLDFFKNTIVSGSIDNTLRIWGEESRSAVLKGHKLGVYCLQVHDDSIISGSEDGSILEWTYPDHAPSPKAKLTGLEGPAAPVEENNSNSYDNKGASSFAQNGNGGHAIGNGNGVSSIVSRYENA